MESTHKHCQNCDHLLDDDFRYCPECGQKTNDQLTMTVLFSNTISNYFSVDARFFVSFLPLLFRPGYLPERFIEGKRLRYLHPAQFYLFISVVFFFLLSFETRRQQAAFDESMKESFSVKVDSAEMARADSIKNVAIREALENTEVYADTSSFSPADLDSILNNSAITADNVFQDEQSKLDSLIEHDASLEEKLEAMGLKDSAAAWKRKVYIQALKIYEKRGGGLLEAFYDTIPVAMFFLLPIYALLLKLFFYRKGRFAHHLVFSFYFFSFLFTLFSLMLLFNLFIAVPGWINGLVLSSTVVYLIVGIKRFYNIRYAEAFIRSFAVSFLYFLFVIPTSFVIISLVSFLIY